MFSIFSAPGTQVEKCIVQIIIVAVWMTDICEEYSCISHFPIPKIVGLGMLSSRKGSEIVS